MSKNMHAHERIRLTAKDSKKFVEVLIDPPPVNEAMKRAIKRHDDFFSDTCDSEGI